MVNAYCKKYKITRKVYETRKNFVLKAIERNTLKNVSGKIRKNMEEVHQAHLIETIGFLNV